MDSSIAFVPHCAQNDKSGKFYLQRERANFSHNARVTFSIARLVARIGNRRNHARHRDAALRDGTDVFQADAANRRARQIGGALHGAQTIEADGLAGVGFGLRGVNRADADNVGARALRFACASSGVPHEAPMRKPAGVIARTSAMGQSSGPRCTPSAPQSRARSRRSLINNNAWCWRVNWRSSRAICRSGRGAVVLSRIWIIEAPPASAARAMARCPPPIWASVRT